MNCEAFCPRLCQHCRPPGRPALWMPSPALWLPSEDNPYVFNGAGSGGFQGSGYRVQCYFTQPRRVNCEAFCPRLCQRCRPPGCPALWLPSPALWLPSKLNPCVFNGAGCPNLLALLALGFNLSCTPCEAAQSRLMRFGRYRQSSVPSVNKLMLS